MNEIVCLTEEEIQKFIATKADEFIIEQIYRTSNNKVLTRCIGKVFVPKTLFLNNQQLEDIWKLSNFSVSYPEMIILTEGTYKFCECYFLNKDLLFIKTKNYSGIMNDDIVIYKKYSDKNNYYISNDNRKSKDTWVYESKEQMFNYFKYHDYLNIFI